MHRKKVKVMEDALDANTTIANANREDFDRAGVRVVNLMSAPGAGKTSVLERVVGDIDGVRVGVLEGDVQGSFDADRLTAANIPVVQLNTDSGFGGECHLDANMVRSAMRELPLKDIDLLIIENVGNLVCPAEFKVGEDVRVMISAVTEGEDKPAKYPLMFRTCDLVLVNKIDLLPHLDYDLDRFAYYLDAVHPDVPRIHTSARTGEGLTELRAWLGEVAAHGRAPGHDHDHDDHDHDHDHDAHDHDDDGHDDDGHDHGDRERYDLGHAGGHDHSHQDANAYRGDKEVVEAGSA